jgi:hypothetical protein
MKLLKRIFKDAVEDLMKGTVIAVSNLKVAMLSVVVFVQTGE